LVERLKSSDYIDEAYAIFRDRFISSNDHSDGATIIDGVPVELNGNALSRIRYLTPYNFIIAPKNSPINNGRYDIESEEILNKILKGELTLDDYIDFFMKLPKNNIHQI